MKNKLKDIFFPRVSFLHYCCDTSILGSIGGIKDTGIGIGTTLYLMFCAAQISYLDLNEKFFSADVTF